VGIKIKVSIRGFGNGILSVDLANAAVVTINVNK